MQNEHISTRPVRAPGSKAVPWWAGASDVPTDAPAAPQSDTEPGAKGRMAAAEDSSEAAKAAAVHPSEGVTEQQGSEAGAHAEEGGAAAAPVQAASRDSRRPSGVSKIDLTAVWGQAPTPAVGAPGQDKENSAAAVLPRVHRPVPAGASRFGTQAEANPLAALHPGCVLCSADGGDRPAQAAHTHAARCRVLEAAMKARAAHAPGPHMPAAQPGKRKLLPAPKPPVGALPRSMLFGQNFQIPRLSRQ